MDAQTGRHSHNLHNPSLLRRIWIWTAGIEAGEEGDKFIPHLETLRIRLFEKKAKYYTIKKEVCRNSDDAKCPSPYAQSGSRSNFLNTVSPSFENVNKIQKSDQSYLDAVKNDEIYTTRRILHLKCVFADIKKKPCTCRWCKILISYVRNGQVYSFWNSYTTYIWKCQQNSKVRS